MKFAADAMLGSLVKWLRILGYDTSYQRDIEDDALVLGARSEGRLILTRDTRLVRRLEPDEYLFIRDNALKDQLRQAVTELGLEAGAGGAGLLSRCTLCNEPLRRVDKESVRGLVPEYTFGRAGEFNICPACGKAYWSGTHRARILKLLAEIQERQ